MPDSTRESQSGPGLLIVRVAVASAIVFVVLLLWHLFWLLGLLATIPAAGFLLFYLKWAIQQTRYAEDRVEEVNVVQKEVQTEEIEAAEMPVAEKQSLVIEPTGKKQGNNAVTTSKLPLRKYCGFCGRLMSTTYTFCPVCGKAQMETEATTMEAKTVPVQQPRRSMKAIAVAVTLVVVLGGSALTLYLFSVGMIGPLTPCQQQPALCSMQAGVQNGHELIIMMAYNFAADGRLTVTLENAGVVENMAGSQYFMCITPESCVQETLGGTCSNASFLATDSSCQATITVPVTGLVSGAAYEFKVITPTGAVFRYSVNFGDSVTGHTYG